MRTLPRRRSILPVVALSILASLTLLTAVPVFADGPSGAQAAAAGIAFLFMGVIFIAGYIYMSLALQTIAKKTNTENPWLGQTKCRGFRCQVSGVRLTAAPCRFCDSAVKRDSNLFILRTQ